MFGDAQLSQERELIPVAPLAHDLAIQALVTQIAQERDEEARGLWRLLASRFDARRLVFVDESGFNTSTTRLRARAPKGKRAYGKVPRNRGKNTTLIASITLQGAMGESMTLEGATDAAAFEAYVEHFPLRHPFVKGR